MTAHVYPWGDGRTFRAIKVTPFNFDEVEELVGGDGGTHPDGGLVFATPNGPLRTAVGDYVLAYDTGVYIRMSTESFESVYPPRTRIDTEGTT